MADKDKKETPETQDDLEQKLKKDKWLRVIDFGVPLIGIGFSIYFGVKQFHNMPDISSIRGKEGLELAGQILKEWKYLWCMAGSGVLGFMARDIIKHIYMKTTGKYKEKKQKKKETLGSKLKQIRAEKGLIAAAAYPIKRFFEVMGTSLKLSYINFRGRFNPEYQYQKLKEMKDSGCDYFILYKGLYNNHMRKKQYEEAVLSLVDLIRTVRKQKAWVNPLETKNYLFLRVINPFRKRDFFYHLENIFLIFVCSEYADAFDEINKRRQILTEDPEKSLLTATLVDEFIQDVDLVDESWVELSHRLWNTAIDQIYADDRIKQEKAADSLNVVRSFGPSKFLSSSLIIKENPDREHLEEERDKIQELEEVVLDHPRLHVPQVVYLSDNQKEGRYIMIERRKQGTLLSESTDIAAFEEAAEYLALIHSRLRSRKGKRDYKTANSKRIIESPYDFLKPLVDEWGFLFENIKGDFVINKDAHGGNWINNEDGTIALDFEDRGYSRQEYDVVKLIEESSFFNDGNTEKRMKVISKYTSDYGVKDKQEFMKGYLSAVFPCAIGYFVFSTSKGYGSNEVRRNFLQNARRSLHQLGTERARNLEKYIDKSIAVLS